MKKRTLATLLAIIMLFTISGCGNSAAESYKTMAQNFIDEGNIESARKTLEDGIAETNNKDLQAMLDGLSNADLSEYDGVWAEEDLNYENGGLIMSVSTFEGATLLTFEYAEESVGYTDGPLEHYILKNEVDGSSVTIKKSMDIYENLVDMAITFSGDSVTCEVTNIEEADISSLLKEGTYTLVRNDDAYSILSEEPWSDGMGAKADGFTEEPYHDISKASGILAQLGMTEEEFRASCQPLINWTADSDGRRTTQELLDYPSNYIGQHFKMVNTWGLSSIDGIEIDAKGESSDGYVTYGYFPSYDSEDYILIYDFRDDVYSPTISEGEKIQCYMIFTGIQTLDGVDFVTFNLISADK